MNVCDKEHIDAHLVASIIISVFLFVESIILGGILIERQRLSQELLHRTNPRVDYELL